ncbi:hypothetical protein BD410DRAFT_739689 [Rickenella mellea]|uniref:Uncharacterized protein n=1 Tax=Rickenella mellea TaxID=50990 RepID=A0A4Y7QLQ5_9AGAM|nr:hypothetical protein BD410DRAFT_739689 [Rickenella mellea]
MSSQLSPLSASVTRILSLVGFPKELKTRDIQAAFSEWENVMGGFRIKWIDDTSLLIVFQDAGVAKRAYLQALASPPASIFAPASGDSTAVIKPYDGPDAQSVIQNVNSRHNSTASRGHNSRSSISINGIGAHARVGSSSNRNGNGNASPINNLNGTIPEHATSPPMSISTSTSNGSNLSSIGREPSPTLPSIPAHPTLNSLILSSFNGSGEDGSLLNDPAILASSADSPSSGPRIGDPGKRMLGAALGMRHPGLPPRSMSGGHSGGGADQALKEVQKALGGVTVSE